MGQALGVPGTEDELKASWTRPIMSPLLWYFDGSGELTTTTARDVAFQDDGVGPNGNSAVAIIQIAVLADIHDGLILARIPLWKVRGNSLVKNFLISCTLG